jgi:hypothetical protein
MTTFDPIHRTQGVLAGLPCSWYVCGGWALDLFLGRLTRPHKDVDIAIARRDQAVARAYLGERGWSLEVAEGGMLRPWGDRWLALPVHCIWCRNERSDPSFLELLLNEIDETGFRFRRDEAVTLAREQMSFIATGGVSVLTPEIVLLYKASRPDENAADLENTVNHLTGERRRWLKGALQKLYGCHDWEGRL